MERNTERTEGDSQVTDGTIRDDKEWLSMEPFFFFVCATRCHYCKQFVKGRLIMNKLMRVIDSPGFMLFEDGLMCESCLKKRGGGDPNTEVDMNNIDEFFKTLESWGYEPNFDKK